ncbi:hypothetical protein SAMN02745166_04537 [Prosthecobacter debontii]|uniref:HD/PDEase domain-containing protein n=1 Tax=Prosthecobacter debontii TaxID=48467 RepID=A0A1T4YYB0_9BACT|nr:HDIG domain-containing metalloprotein [Prosthecobacter debontii]SKB06779.1 hypothetical protein SAMN02745166_04537 [Prosthecobacter debontii]
MFDSIRRAKLQRAGLSCGKRRLKHQEGDLVDELRTHPAATVAVYAAFFLVLGLLMKMGAAVIPGTVTPQPIAYICMAAIASALVVHLRVALREDVEDNAELALVLGTILLQMAANVAMLDYGNQQSWTGALLVVAMPHAFAPLVLSVILGRRMGLFAAIYSTLLGSMVCVAVNPITYLASSSLIGFLVVLFTKRVRRRNRLFMSGLYIGGVASLFSLLLYEASGTGLGAVSVGRMLGVPLATGMITGLLVGGLLPVIESIFGVTTEISWLELADLNHPLMKRLSIEAPGTYHHSLVVANLSEAAAEAIGANAAMTRVCAYFHDIGKLTKPEYFIENMDPSDNPHDDLTARMSALILIAHVKDGVDLAIKHKLNVSIIDVIEQHHGTSLAWYFYKRALEQKAEMIRLVEQGKSKEDDVPQVSEGVFRYPGPTPQFKESAIISLADAVESASRTLEKPNASRIEALVDDLVMDRMKDGQLDECDLTIADLAKVKASFVKTLLSMMHSRIKYQKAAETSNVSTNLIPKEGSSTPAPAVHDGNTLVMDSPYATGDKKRQGRKPPSAA